MNEHEIIIDIYASWSEKPPTYRIWVDSDLITERDFIWPSSEMFIRERILVNIDSTSVHRIKVEELREEGHIIIKNVLIDGRGIGTKTEFVITE